jgi:hypothetical protein
MTAAEIFGEEYPEFFRVARSARIDPDRGASLAP